MNSSMSGRSAFWLLLVFAVGSTAAESTLAPCAGVLVLRNGEMLTGAIVRTGDRYTVVLGESGELRIAATDVEMFCRDMDEAYERRRAMLPDRGAATHVELADWCLRHGLSSRAADELLAAMERDARHPQIPLLERRLQLAAGGSAPRPRTGRDSLPTVSLDELERTVRQLPAESVERFTAQVQPLLLNRCSASACHGDSSSSSFHLVRPPRGHSVVRRFTQRNLYAALQNVNRETPAESPLLKIPSGPHGPLASAVFRESEQSQLRLLTDWVRSLGGKRRPTPQTARAELPSLQQASFIEPVLLPGARHDPDRSVAPAAAGASLPTPGRGRPLADTPSARDPFDPAAFNRRDRTPGAVE
jgi:hypothetical protein